MKMYKYTYNTYIYDDTYKHHSGIVEINKLEKTHTNVHFIGTITLTFTFMKIWRYVQKLIM